MNNELSVVEFTEARRAMLAQASATVELALGYFDPDHLIDELGRNLPAALRVLASALEVGAIEGRLAGAAASAGSDDRAHLRVTLALAAPVRKALAVQG